uniref:phosphonopyruvate decarboxylase n=1 Tax=Shewanella baltica TaxID=62322 RepID=UPI00404805CD
MISPAEFSAELHKLGIHFFTGVPDSLLQSLCAYIDDTLPVGQHTITANEGNALAMAAGYYLGTGKPACVYMQNSGLGNVVNPLTSLTDAEVYRIPALLIIGWRGEPGVKDEPQHVKQGRITPQMLSLLDVPAFSLHAESDFQTVLAQATSTMLSSQCPVAILVHKDTFSAYKPMKVSETKTQFSREAALKTLLQLSEADTAFVATTGKTSRELYELREQAGQIQRDFLTVGSMGHASSIALGLALAKPTQKVTCLDGDGALLMHLGAAAIIAQSKATNLLHVVLNNSAHESVGGQQTVAGNLDLKSVALALGYQNYFHAASATELEMIWQQCAASEGPNMLEITIACGSRADLARPKNTPEQNKQAFMEHLAHASS